MTLVPFVPTKLQLLGGIGAVLAAGAVFTFMHLQQNQNQTLRAETVEPKSSNQQGAVANEPAADVTVNGQKVDSLGTTRMDIPGGGTATVTISGNANSANVSANKSLDPVEINVQNSSNGNSTSITSNSSSYNSSSGNRTTSRSSQRVHVNGSAKVEVNTSQ